MNLEKKDTSAPASTPARNTETRQRIRSVFLERPASTGLEQPGTVAAKKPAEKQKAPEKLQTYDARDVKDAVVAPILQFSTAPGSAISAKKNISIDDVMGWTLAQLLLDDRLMEKEQNLKTSGEKRDNNVRELNWSSEEVYQDGLIATKKSYVFKPVGAAANTNRSRIRINFLISPTGSPHMVAMIVEPVEPPKQQIGGDRGDRKDLGGDRKDQIPLSLNAMTEFQTLQVWMNRFLGDTGIFKTIKVTPESLAAAYSKVEQAYTESQAVVEATKAKERDEHQRWEQRWERERKKAQAIEAVMNQFKFDLSPDFEDLSTFLAFLLIASKKNGLDLAEVDPRRKNFTHGLVDASGKVPVYLGVNIDERGIFSVKLNKKLSAKHLEPLWSQYPINWDDFEKNLGGLIDVKEFLSGQSLKDFHDGAYKAKFKEMCFRYNARLMLEPPSEAVVVSDQTSPIFAELCEVDFFMSGLNRDSWLRAQPFINRMESVWKDMEQRTGRKRPKFAYQDIDDFFRINLAYAYRDRNVDRRTFLELVTMTEQFYGQKLEQVGGSFASLHSDIFSETGPFSKILKEEGDFLKKQKQRSEQKDGQQGEGAPEFQVAREASQPAPSASSQPQAQAAKANAVPIVDKTVERTN